LNFYKFKELGEKYLNKLDNKDMLDHRMIDHIGLSGKEELTKVKTLPNI